MNIILCGRTSLFEDIGGDTIQITKYRDYLEKQRQQVSIRPELAPACKAGDIVHCFNIQVVDQTHAQIRHAKRRGATVVFSPIYWSMAEYQGYRRKHARELGHGPAKEWAKQRWNSHYDCLRRMLEQQPRGPQLQSFLRLLGKGRRRMQLECLQMADRILVSAASEKAVLVRDYNFHHPEKIKVVPNGVDPAFFRAQADGFVQRFGLKDFLLCVGRVEPHKNQVAVIRAAQALPYPLVIIGTQRDSRYAALCRSADGGKTHFLGFFPHDLLPSAYAAARAHVLASWFDIPGLVNLEAGAAGCNVISTDRGSAADYLGQEAWYLQPNDLGSIRHAIGAAMESAKTGRLAERLRAEYSWEGIARRLLGNYQEVRG